MTTVYTYSKSGDFSGKLASNQLANEINADTGITSDCSKVKNESYAPDIVDIIFASELSISEQVTLNELVMAHTP